VIGLSLLILFHLPIGGTNLEEWLQQRIGIRITYAQPAVVLAQFAVACAFAVQTMRVTFDQIDARPEIVALTLGCRRSQAFLEIALPQAWRGIVAATTIAWARSLGEFGPILVFAGATRMRTEVLSTTVFLELSVGQLEAAVAVSLLMVAAAMAVLGIVRLLGAKVSR
jgi:molybdate transport system permease protein